MIELLETSNSDFLKMPRRTLTGGARWKDIEDLINRWARRNPLGAFELEAYIKETKIGLVNKRLAKTDGALGRMGLALHPELMQYIEAFYPDFLSTKDEMHEFMKRFSKFRIPEVV